MSGQAFDVDTLPAGEYGIPGPLRDRLVGAILDGTKVATSSLADEWIAEGLPLPAAGDLEAVVDSSNRRVCVTRNVAVEVVRLADVTDSHAVREGEGFSGAQDWRIAHERFWSAHSSVALTDDTNVVCVDLEVVHRIS